MDLYPDSRAIDAILTVAVIVIALSNAIAVGILIYMLWSF